MNNLCRVSNRHVFFYLGTVRIAQYAPSKSIQKSKMGDLRSFIRLKWPSLKFGSRTCHASGSSSPTPSLTTSVSWLCTWDCQIGTMRSLRLALTHKPCSGSASCPRKDSPSILKTGVHRKSLQGGRTQELQLPQPRASVAWIATSSTTRSR